MRHLSLLLSLGFCLLLAACEFQMQEAEAEAEADSLRVPRALVRVAIPEQGRIQARVRATGNLEPRDYVEIFPELLGRVARVDVDLRSAVAAGDTLAVLASAEQRLAYLTAVERVKRLEAVLKRQEELNRRGGIGNDALDETRNSLVLAEIDVEVAALTLSKTALLSPIDGTVTAIDIRVGELLSQRRLFRIEDLSELLTKVFIPERDIPSLEVGQPVEIFHPSREEPYDAAVTTIAPTLDPDSGTGEVHITLSEAKGLRAGYFVEAEIVVEDRPDALLVPKKAVLREPGGNFLVLAVPEKVGGDSADSRLARAVRVEVEIGLEDSARAEILAASGLPEGLTLAALQVVIEGQYGLLDETALKVVD